MASVTFFASEALSVADSSTSFTSATYLGADYAHVYVDVADVRILASGTTVTTSNGIPVSVGDEIILESADEIAGFRAIRDGSTTATLITQFGKRK